MTSISFVFVFHVNTVSYVYIQKRPDQRLARRQHAAHLRVAIWPFLMFVRNKMI